MSKVSLAGDSVMEVIWHGYRDWGVECYRDFVDGTHYRRATKRETPDLTVPTPHGDVELRRMTRVEIRFINPDREEPQPRSRRRRRAR